MTPAQRISPVRQFFKSSTARFALAGVGVALVLLAINVAWTYRNTHELKDNFFWVAHTHEVIAGLEDVLSLAKDAETGQRGYLLTSDKAYLEPYHDAVARIDQAVARIEQLTSDNVRQQAHVRELKVRLANRLGIIEEAIQELDGGGADSAREVVLSGRGKLEMDRLRRVIAEMINEERTLLEERMTASQHNYNVAVTTGLVTGLAALAALIALVVVAAADVRRRLFEAEAKRMQLADLAHASRLSTVGQMMSELAHELNHPLAAANNFARACLTAAKSSGGSDAAQIVDWIEKTAGQTERAIEIVRRINAFAKKESGPRTPVNLNQLVENVVSLTVPTIRSVSNGHTIDTVVDFDQSLPEIYMDRVQIEQVLVNLIRNAIEAMQTPECHERSLELATRRVNGSVEVSVRDHGCGISAEQMTKLFQPYFTTKSSGMGLGLSICRSIVELHEGRLDAETLADGARFKFTLPIGAGKS